MRRLFRKPSVLARLAVPVFLSVGLHVLLVLGLWQMPLYQPAPAAVRDVTTIAEDDYPLGLDDSPPPKPREAAPVMQASFDVRLVEAPPAPALSPPAMLAASGAGICATGGLPTRVGDVAAARADKPPVAQQASARVGDAAPARADKPPVAQQSSAPGGVENDTGDGGRPCALEVGTTARSVVYVVDRSMSMGFHGGLARARREVLASLRRLPSAVRFQVIAYERTAEPLAIDGRAGLLPTDENTLRQVADAVTALRAGGGTDHGRALRRGIAFHPDVLYFLTDADDISMDDVRAVTRLNDRRTVIHTVELSGGRETRPDGPLRKLAADNGGAYRRLDPEE